MLRIYVGSNARPMARNECVSAPKMRATSPAEMSIIIPVYNPEEPILARVLAAIESLETNTGSSVECVIVDNNSQQPVHELAIVRSFLDRCHWARVIREPRQGLTFSRMAGIKATTAPVIIVFDDDNEPAADYLKMARFCLDTWPCVGVWGPGRISLAFLNPVPEWFRRRFGEAFNEKDQPYPEFGCVPASWARFYPIGMGQIIRREVAERYLEAVEGGRLSSTDRKGNNLASGGDVQLVWEAVKMGFAAGVHPGLQVTHLIPQRRANLSYVKRVAFGCAASYLPALVESFSSEKATISNRIPSNLHILGRLLRITLRNMSRFQFRYLAVELAPFLGEVVGTLRAAHSQKRRWVFGLVKLLKLE